MECALLDVLPRPLLCRSWPEDKVILGLCVCKTVRSELQSSGVDVLLTVRRARPFAKEDLVTSLMGLTCFRIKLCWAPPAESYRQSEGALILNAAAVAVSKAAKEGGRLHCAVVHLDLGMFKAYGGNAEKLMPSMWHLLAKSEKLEHLELSDCNVSCDLFGALQSCPSRSFSHLGLGGLELNNRNATQLAEMLRGGSTLTHLALDRNSIGGPGMSALAPALSSHSSLSLLNLRYNDGIGPAATTALCAALKHCPGLRDLNLYNVGMAGAGVESFCDILPHWTGLVSLDLSLNSITGTPAARLGRSLSYLTSLRMLSLGGNALGGAVRELAVSLRACPLLTVLDLRQCSIGGEGAGALGGALGACGRLTRLDVTWNEEVGDDGARSLAEGLRQCGSLTHLDAAWCGIRGEGAAALVEAALSVSSLQSVDMQCNLIPASDAEHWHTTWQARRGDGLQIQMQNQP